MISFILMTSFSPCRWARQCYSHLVNEAWWRLCLRSPIFWGIAGISSWGPQPGRVDEHPSGGRVSGPQAGQKTRVRVHSESGLEG